MFQYLVELKQPLLGTTFYRSDLFEKDPNKATRFGTYQQALNHITAILAGSVLGEPLEIRILPAPDDGPWTLEEILTREG